MKNLFSLLIFVLFLNNCWSQILPDPDETLRAGDKVPKVMIIGTFHFGYPGQDSHKTDKDEQIDILSDQKQKELDELLTYIEKYKPTKIMLESGYNTGYLMNRYRRWKKGEEELKRNERDQMGIKLMDRLNLDTLYGVDANSLSREWYNSKDSISIRPALSQIFDNVKDSKSKFDDRYWKWYDQDDVLTYNTPLLQYFKYQNEDKVIKRMHGHYILGDQSDSYNDVDALALNWYSRNLRIYKNILNIETKSDDKVLVLIGAGHAAILKQQFEANPMYELIEFNDLEKM